MSEPNDENWLREGLAGAVPEPPAVPDRADGARARARRARRTTLLAAGGVAASVLLVAGVVATVGGSSPDDGRAADGGPGSPYDAPACPASPVDTQTQVGPDHVPDGASSVRLCGGNEVPVDVPADALVSGVDDLAATINGLEPASSDMACTMELGPAYQLVFAYPDGSAVVASGELYGCRQVVVDGVERVGADEPWKKFIDLLRAQRQQSDPPGRLDVPAFDCAASAPTASVGRPQDLAVASVCVEQKPLGSGSWIRVEIKKPDLAVIRRDAADPSHQASGLPRCAARPAAHIVGVTPWGDRIELRPECYLSYFRSTGLDAWVWNPTDETQAILERLVGEAR